MNDFDNLPFYDSDPDAKESATEASRDRVRVGFRKLMDALQGPSLAAREASDKKWREKMARMNEAVGERDGHFVPEGGSIKVSPMLAERLQRR